MAPLTSGELHPNPPLATTLNLTLRALSDVSCLLGFSALERLDLSCNSIRTLQGLSGCCGNLKWLSVAQNKIESLKGVEGLSNLRVFNAGQNMIQSIEEVRYLTNLRALILNDNSISVVCKLEPLKNLNTLVLSRNPIKDLGKSLVNVKSLKKISFSNCEIEEIGSSLVFCAELREARFAHNHIVTIPSQIEKNGKLQLLDLGNNAISRWSDLKVLSELSNLRNLSLQGNPIAERDKIVKKLIKLVRKLQIFNGKPIEKFSKTKKNPAEDVPTNKNDAISLVAQEPEGKEGRKGAGAVNTDISCKRKKVKSEYQVICSEAIKNENSHFCSGEAKFVKENNKKQSKPESKSWKSKTTTAASGNGDVGKSSESKRSKDLEFDDCDISFMDFVFSGMEDEVGKQDDESFRGGFVIHPGKGENTKKKKKKGASNTITGRSVLEHLPEATDVGAGGPSAWDD